MYWALTRDTRRLPCVKIEVDGAYCSAYAIAWGMHAGSSTHALQCWLRVSVDYWYRKVQEKSIPRYKRSVRLVGACHIALGAACLGAYLGYYGNHVHMENCTWRIVNNLRCLWCKLFMLHFNGYRIQIRPLLLCIHKIQDL